MAVQPVAPFPHIPAFQQPVNMITQESTRSLQFDGSRQDSRGYNSTIGVSDGQQARYPTYDRSSGYDSVNVITQESTGSLRFDGSRQDSREYNSINGVSDRQQARHLTYDRPSDYNWQGGNTAQASNSSARDPHHIGSQTRAGQEVKQLWNSSAAAQPALNHDSRHDPRFTTSNAVPYRGTVFPPVQKNTIPLSETSGPYRNPHMRLPPLQEVVSLPPITEPADSTRADQGHQLPRHGDTLILPNACEGRRLKERAVGGPPPLLIPGPTVPLGPPLKPFDGPRAEAIAQEQWNSVMAENGRRR